MYWVISTFHTTIHIKEVLFFIVVTDYADHCPSNSLWTEESFITNLDIYCLPLAMLFSLITNLRDITNHLGFQSSRD